MVKENESDEEQEVAPASQPGSPLLPGEIPSKEYDYLLSMPMWSLTDEKVTDLQAQLADREA